MHTRVLPRDNKQENNDGNMLLTVEDVRDRLQVSLRTARELTARGKIAIVKIGRSVRVREQDLNAFIQDNLVKEVKP